MERKFDLATNEINNFKDDIFEVGGERIAFAVDNEFAQEIVDYLNNKYGAVAEPENENSGLHLQRVVQAKPEKYCKGSIALGTGCKKCKRCLDYMSKFKIL